ncbi:MAG: hypothetical protein K1X28_06185 [Parachlamydiales bacterium]|nr:hypothetical protein [Parachlamydiales bacterium]
MSLSFGEVVSAYRYLRNETGNAAAANRFAEFLELLGQATTQDTMKIAIKALINLSKFLPLTGNTEIDLPTNPTVRQLRQEGIDLVNQIKRIQSNDDISTLVKKVKEIAKKHFSAPAQAEPVLAEAARQQQNRLVGAKTIAGFVGLYELAFNRPHSLRSDNALAARLKGMIIPLIRILQSFPQSGAQVGEAEALAHLGTLMTQIVANKDQFLALCEADSATAKMIGNLANFQGNADASKAFYRLLKNAAIQHCYDLGICGSTMDTVLPEHITQLFKEQSEVVAKLLPEHLQPDHAETGRIVAQGFKKQEDHGQGALLFGQLGLNMHHEQFFGEGINWDPSFTPIDPYSDISKDSIESDKAREIATKIGEDIAHGFYQNRQLAQHKYTITGDAVIAEPVNDPNAQALMTVNCLIQYELQRHVIEHGHLFGLDANQRLALAPEKAKKVILFGINNDVFSKDQVLLLLITYQLMGDADIMAAINEALIRNAPPIDVYEEEAANLRKIDL